MIVYHGSIQSVGKPDILHMYHSGIWDKERAINEIKVYKTYDQIAFITQRSIDQLLRIESFYEVKRWMEVKYPAAELTGHGICLSQQSCGVFDPRGHARMVQASLPILTLPMRE